MVIQSNCHDNQSLFSIEKLFAQ